MKNRALTRLDRFILASFILCPVQAHEKGRRPATIGKTAIYAFRKVTGHSNQNIVGLIVSTACRKLERLGYLERVGSVPVLFTIPYRYRAPEVKRYDSPLFLPTESGMMLALSHVDVAELPMLQPGRKLCNAPHAVKTFYFVYGYNPREWEVSHAFLKSMGITRTKRLHISSTSDSMDW